MLLCISDRHPHMTVLVQLGLPHSLAEDSTPWDTHHLNPEAQQACVNIVWLEQLP